MRIQTLADALNGRIIGESSREITAVASLAAAGPGDLTFIEDAKYLAEADKCRAGVVLVGEFAAQGVPGFAGTLIVVAAPRLAFAKASAMISRSKRTPTGIHATAIVDPSTTIGAGVSIDALAVIGKNVRIANGTSIGPNCVLFDDVSLGEDCELVGRVTVYSHTAIGNRVVVHAGAVLGSDGFGFVRDEADGSYHKFPQIGRLEIGDDVEIGANSTIDRGALDATVIGSGTKLDNMVHVGHNARIGRNVVVAAQTGISGSSVLEDNVVVAGQVGIADHVRIEEGVILGAQCGVPSNKVIRGNGQLFWGTPARPIREYLKELAVLARLTKKK
jgi:UDP-3-O-[3-hydroxymyristoyl] glucosamine N-acyltransferase